MAFVLKADCSAGDAYVVFSQNLLYTGSEFWLTFKAAVPSATLAAILAIPSYNTADFNGAPVGSGQHRDGFLLGDYFTAGSLASPTSITADQAPGVVASAFSADAWHTIEQHNDGTTMEWYLDGTLILSYARSETLPSTGHPDAVWVGASDPKAVSGEIYYFADVKLGTSRGAADLFADDFASGDTSAWSSVVGSPTVIDDPFPSGTTTGRVMIAFDDGPLEPSPTWTRIDGGDDPFPQNFVSGYDVETGRQTLISQTDAGRATVYIYDHVSALFDPRNVSSPYFGLLDGRQILLQLYDPVAAAWEDQFRGWINDITWDIDGSAVGADGFPINATIQLECVDMFAYLAAYGLTPGLDGVTPQTVPSGTAGGAPPTGYEDGVYYAATAGSVDDRFIEVLTDVGIDSTRYTIASGNVHVKAAKYDPDESALVALRDAADAELPFIANIYCDRHGNFQFRGRYSRFNPDDVAAEPGSTWDFTRWAVGDGAAIVADATRAQMRLLSFARNRSDLINVAVAYPQDMPAADMPGQVWADTASILAYGKHSAPPMSDLLTDGSDVGGYTDIQETSKYAKLLVLNQKDPRENVSSLQVKAIRPDDPRAATTWALLTRADISHIINVAVGYPSGTGLTGASPDDDYYIEGRHLRVRPLNPSHDYVECDYNLSPAIWSMDTHNVFDPFPVTALSAGFSYST